jgi:hypothetical protein
VSGVFTHPFHFFGGYVQLSEKEKVGLAENQIIQYYRGCVCELEEKNRMLDTEIVLIKDMNV